MPQTLPHSPVAHPDPGLHLMPADRPAPQLARERPTRGLLLIVLLGGCVLGYLCLLVRISAVDVRCLQSETEREELRTVIATDLTELSVLSDTATNLDQADRNGLCPAEGRDELPVSREWCASPAPGAEAGAEGVEPDSPALAAGMGAY